MKESTFKGVGGLKIFTRSWQPEGKTRGVVVIVHGLNSHSGQYLWVGEQFAAKDLAAYAIDLRGRGRSEGERYYVEKMEDYTDDVATLVRIAKSENPGLPVFVLGHSVGGVISCVYTLDHQSEIDGLICESFAYDLPVPELTGRVIDQTKTVGVTSANFSALAATGALKTLNNYDAAQVLLPTLNCSALPASATRGVTDMSDSTPLSVTGCPAIAPPGLLFSDTAVRCLTADHVRFALLDS